MPYVSMPEVYSSPAPSSAVPDWTPHMDLDLIHHLAMPAVDNWSCYHHPRSTHAAQVLWDRILVSGDPAPPVLGSLQLSPTPQLTDTNTKKS